MTEKWCPVCCTRHDLGPECPGELLATGPERHGFRAEVATGSRIEVYGVLVAEAGELWRARILTLPNMLWSIPAGRGTMKFVAGSARDAERLAREFLVAHCRRRQYRFSESTAEVECGPPAAAEAGGHEPRGARHPRYLRHVPILFGAVRPTERATTADLSAGGLFIATGQPLAKGRRLRMRLQLADYTIPLVGTVVWLRREAELDRPAGMGVELQRPSAIYLRYVETLT